MPFYLRTGKRLGRRVTEIAVVFKRAPYLPFESGATEELGQNALVIRVQPDEGVTVRFGSKVPGTSMEVRDVTMDFAYGESFTESSPEAYERLILDVLLGDANLFPRHQEVELSLEDPRPDRGVLGQARQARAVRVRHLGSGRGGRDARTRRHGAGAGHEDRSDGHHVLQASTPALIEARRAIGTPAVGMVLTLVIVTDEGSAYDALKAAHEASKEHPSRILVVIKRPGRSPRDRALARLDAEVVVGDEAGTGETVVLRMHGELANHAESVVLPLLLPDAPVVCWWPDKAPGERGARTRWAGWPSAGSPTPRRPRTRWPPSGCGRRRTPPATPTWPGPGSPRGARCWRPRWTRSTARSLGAAVEGEAYNPSARAAGPVAGGPARACRWSARSPAVPG